MSRQRRRIGRLERNDGYRHQILSVFQMELTQPDYHSNSQTDQEHRLTRLESHVSNTPAGEMTLSFRN